MSFYGNIKRVNSSPFVFDRYFPSRKDMEEKLENASDGVYVGRYVLIRYDCIKPILQIQISLANGIGEKLKKQLKKISQLKMKDIHRIGELIQKNMATHLMELFGKKFIQLLMVLQKKNILWQQN